MTGGGPKQKYREQQRQEDLVRQRNELADIRPYEDRREAVTDLSELLARVKAAEGPDRRLDRDIFIAVLGSVPELAGHVAGIIAGGGHGYPEYTRSIDAALGLVERKLPGWRVENLCEWDDETLRARGPWTCDLIPRGEDFSHGHVAKCAHAPTPALALVAALLSALQATP